MAYNSQFTGAQIDEAIADVRSNKDAWNGKQDVILASGAAVGDLIKVKAVDARGKPTACRPSRRGVSRNGVLAEKFHILTSTGALNLQLFDCKYEDVRKAAVLRTLEAIFSKH